MALLNSSISNFCDVEYTKTGPKPKISFRRSPFFMNIRDWDSSQRDYFYVEFKDADVFNLIDISTIVPEPILSCIMDPDSECFLILANTHEAFNKAVLSIYKYVVIKHQVPAHKCVLYTGSFTADYEVERVSEMLEMPKIGVAVCVDFEFAAKSVIQHDQTWVVPNTLQLKEYHKKFLNFNRRWRPHRPMLTAILHSKGLLDQGYISLARSDDNRSWRSSWEHMTFISNCYPPLKQLLSERKQEIISIPPMYLDKRDLTINQAWLDFTVRNYYEDTYFSLVSETNYFNDFADMDQPAFLSEKTFKAIVFKHPFILVSSYNTLAYLKSIGYKTFSPVIDETYDTVKNSCKRLMMIADETERLCNLSKTQLAEFIDFCKPIVEYNYELLLSKQNHIYEVQP